MPSNAANFSLKTFYFSRYSNPLINNDLFYTVQVSCSKPKFATPYLIDKTLEAVYPIGVVGNGYNKNEFEQVYRKILDRNEELIKWELNIIDFIANHYNKYPVLLCYENLKNKETFCHREVLAQWISEKKIAKTEELYDTI